MDRLKRYFKLTDGGGGEIDWGVYRFPDGQIQFWCGSFGDNAVLRASLPDPECLDLFMQIISTKRFSRIRINYLYGARSDKRMNGDKTVCNVASMVLNNIREVANVSPEVLSPHCHERMFGYKPIFSVPREALDGCDIVLFPDESARERFSRSIGGRNFATCLKVRDADGKIVKHEIPSILRGSHVLVVDDLCDGGATFISIANQMDSICLLSLSITHGVFSNGGLSRLKEACYDHIFVTNSLPQEGVLSDIDETVIDVWND